MPDIAPSAINPMEYCPKIRVVPIPAPRDPPGSSLAFFVPIVSAVKNATKNPKVMLNKKTVSTRSIKMLFKSEYVLDKTGKHAYIL